MKTISLCMITGNEAAVILRCLESAKDAFDELCLVRAIGDQTPDNTLKLAVDWCFHNHKHCWTAEYFNQTGGLDHVDDFAAARNKAFSMATEHWQLWLDCDDVLHPEACAGIRECAEEDTADAYCFMYAKPGGSACPRERLIRRGAGVWKNRIHETCSVASGNTCLDESVVIHHVPVMGHAKDSHPRNKRLLQLALEDSDRHLFYLHEEFYHEALGRGPNWEKARAEAIRTGTAALPLLAHKPEECYEICLNLAEILADDHGQKEAGHEWLLRAFALQPWRREALAYLSQEALAAGKTDHAVSYFRVMDALPLPKPLPWTHRGLWFGWGRNYLRVKILRARGQMDQARTEHEKFLEDPNYANAVAGYEVRSAECGVRNQEADTLKGEQQTIAEARV